MRVWWWIIHTSPGRPHNLRVYRSDSPTITPGGSLSAPRGFVGTQICIELLRTKKKQYNRKTILHTHTHTLPILEHFLVRHNSNFKQIKYLYLVG